MDYQHKSIFNTSAILLHVVYRFNGDIAWIQAMDTTKMRHTMEFFDPYIPSTN